MSLLVCGVVGCGNDAQPASPGSDASGGTSTAGSLAAGSGSASAGSVTTAGGVGSGGQASAGTSAGGNVGVGGAPSAGTGGVSGGSGSAEAGAGGVANGGGAGSAGSGGSIGGAGGMGQEPQKPLKVWMAGDSTMQECSSACPCGWGSRFDKLFDANVTVVNRAAGGRSIQTWLYESAVSTNKDATGECTLTSKTYAARWTEMLDAQSGMQKGDYLFMQFGINDSTSECPRHVGQARFKTYLEMMAKAALDRGVTPVMVTPVSAIECSGAMAIGTRGEFVTSTKSAATSASVALVDLHQLSVARYTALGFCPNDGNYAAGKVGAFFCEDHTHFESAGAEEIAKLVAKSIAEAKLPLAAYLLPGL